MVDELTDHSARLFRAANWEGAAQTQWKGPDERGKFTFMEVSVRIIASIGSPVFSGVDIPWMHYQYFTGVTVDRADGYAIGKDSRWFRGDVITVARYLVGDMQSSGDVLPSKLTVFFSWLVDFVRPGLMNDVESWSDPVPGLMELRFLLGSLGRIVKRRSAAGFLSIRARVLRRSATAVSETHSDRRQ